MRPFFMPVVIAVALLLSCEKEKHEEPENLCPVVVADAVPKIVRDSFAVRYPATSVTTWFNKDGVSYCAFFVGAAGEKLIQLANDGTFIKEQIKTRESDENADSTATAGKTSTGCECEIEHEQH